MTEPTAIRKLCIFGAGGFGREVLDVIDAQNAKDHRFEFIGFLDDGDVDLDLLGRRGVRLLNGLSEAVDERAAFTIGIGDTSSRRSIDERLSNAGLEPVTLIHPTASCGFDVDIGSGSVLTAGVRMTTNIRIGRHVHLNLNCTVGHDSVINDFVSVFPGATISGSVSIGAGTTVGTGANLLPGVTIGKDAFIGAGAVVTRDVDDGQTVVGSPAKPLRRPETDSAGQS